MFLPVFPLPEQQKLHRIIADIIIAHFGAGFKCSIFQYFLIKFMQHADLHWFRAKISK